MRKDNILKPASFLFMITIIVAVINFLYNIVMSRMLSISDFGDLRALFSIIMIIAIPITAIQTMMAKFTAEYYESNLGKLKSISRHIFFLIICIGTIFIVAFASLRQPISSYLKVASEDLIVLLGPLLLVILIQPMIWGIYQGLQRFVLLGVSILMSTTLKLILGTFFVSLGFSTSGALFGVLSSTIIATLFFGIILLLLFRKGKSPQVPYNAKEIYSYTGYALGVLICYAIISQIDILIVKHKFLPQEAGIYACSAVIGKGFLFLPVPVVTVLFPKVIENNKLGKSSISILIQTLLISLVLCIIGIAICFLFPQYLMKVFGSKYAQGAHLLKIFGLAMTPLALFYVLMNYFLTKYRITFFYYCLSICALGTSILLIFPKTLNQFLVVLGWFGLLIFILPLGYIIIREKKLDQRMA